MKHLILGIILTSCGQSFEPQLFTAESEATIIDAGAPDNGTHADVVAENDVSHPDNNNPYDSGSDTREQVLCCRKTDFPECEQCPDLQTSDMSCTVEGTRCIFQSSFVEWYVCLNLQWQRGEPFSCR